MTSNYRSRILRESTRDGNNSVASSTGSRHGTVSPDSTLSGASFAPDQDDPYSESTKMFGDTSIPKLRDTAKKYKYPWARGLSPDMLIDTSVLRKTFPNFSQAGSPRDRIDIEKIARLAAQSRHRDQTPTRKSDNINQQKLSTPLAKDSLRQAPAQQKENVTFASYVSGATKSRDGVTRRTLAELHPKVRDESEHSFVSDRIEKSSRFNNTDFTQQSQDNTNTTNPRPWKPQAASKASRAVSQKTASSKPTVSKTTPYKPKSQENITIASSNTRNPTQQSFLLPQGAPEISELVTATFKDGSPVYVQSGAIQSRFSNASKPLLQTHVPVDAIDVPKEEQDIFLSLEMMQERITQLEVEKSDVQRVANDLDKENYKLREDMKHVIAQRRRSDSAIADTGVDAEKSKLQDEINKLKLEVESSKRKIQTLELHLTNNTTERDHAISRVAEFNKIHENLKSENCGLQNEIHSLRQQSEHVASQRDASHQELQLNEDSWKTLQAQLEHKIHVLEENALDYQGFIEDIRNSYTELQEREKSFQDEIATLKYQLRTSTNTYDAFVHKPESDSTAEPTTEDWKNKIYRLEKALRKVMSLKYETYLIKNQRDIYITMNAPVFTQEAQKSQKKSDASNVFKDPALFHAGLQRNFKTPNMEPQEQGEPTPRQSTSPTKGQGSEHQTRKETLTQKSNIGAGFEKVAPSVATRKLKTTSSPRVGLKSALTNAAIKAYGFEDFPWEFEHDDDLTRSSNFDSIVGEGVMQELRDDVVNARHMQSHTPMTANLTNQSKKSATQRALDDDDVFMSNVEASNVIRPSNGQESNQHAEVFELKVPKNLSRFNNSPSKSEGYSRVLETPLETLQQRRQARRHSVPSLDLTGEVDQTYNTTSVSRKSTVLHNRTRSQTRDTGRASRVSNRHRSNSDNMTSAYIIPDIDLSPEVEARSRRQSDASRACRHGLAFHGAEMCDRCAQAASAIVDAQEAGNDMTDLIPVSERVRLSPDAHEHSLRPSMPPLPALEKVLRSLLAEERVMRKQLASLQAQLISHDSSLARTKRQAVAAQVTTLHHGAQEKAEQIYFLYDVLEGLKETEEWNGCQD